MILIQNATVVSPAAGLNGGYDVVIDPITERIAEVALRGHVQTKEIVETIDATGLVLLPGLIDLHVHLREPGFSAKETIYTGTRAARKGGFTTVVCMPNTRPALDTVETLRELKALCERDAVIDVRPTGAITHSIAGERLTDHDALAAEGIAAYSDDGRTTMNPDYMREVFRSSIRHGIPVMTHSEDHDLTSKLGGAASPNEAEDNIIFRDIELCEEIGGRLHVCHVSTGAAVAAIKAAKARGVKVTCEATPHHMALDLSMIDRKDPYTKVNPPIREEADRLAIIEGFRDGTIDAMATDHAPHEASSKEVEYNKATMGISGFETAFSVTYSTLCRDNGFSLSDLVRLTSEHPARILTLCDRGVIRAGMRADLILVDLDAQRTVDSKDFVSKGKNTPFHGRTYYGDVVRTFVGGKYE